jgi:hypothetical protein
MGYTNAGLMNGGKTARFKVTYDSALSQADGRDRANAFLAECENDLDVITDWFEGVKFVFDFPIPIQIATGDGGASWENRAESLRAFDHSTPAVTVQAGSAPAAIVRFLMVGEVTEMYMLSQGREWFEPTTIFKAGDEGSMGEGLSRFLAGQFLRERIPGTVQPSGLAVVDRWLNSNRPNFVAASVDDRMPDQITGCTTLFLYYLHDQLGYSPKQIIANPGKTLGDVYRNLTGRDDGWTSFHDFVNKYYPPPPIKFPPSYTFHPLGDFLFPVAELASLTGPDIVPPAGRITLQIQLDRPAPAEVYIALSSDNQNLIEVQELVHVPTGETSVKFDVRGAFPAPEGGSPTGVRATYGRNQLVHPISLVSPAVRAVGLSPDRVKAGEISTATVFLSVPSVTENVFVQLKNFNTELATIPAELEIPVNEDSRSFTVQTAGDLGPFVTLEANFSATYGGASVLATLTILPSVTVGILESLTLFPPSVNAGGTSRGTVTLVAPVPTDTVVELNVGALQAGGEGDGPQIASVPSTVTVPAGRRRQPFLVTTQSTNVGFHTRYKVTIVAQAVVMKTATLTVAIN